MRFNDLVERLGVPARHVRYMIAEGLIPEGTGTGRNADAWHDRHLAAGVRALDLLARGFTPGAAKLLMRGAARVPIAEIHGVVLSIDPSVDPAGIDVDAVVAAFEAALRDHVARTSTQAEPAPPPNEQE